MKLSSSEISTLDYETRKIFKEYAKYNINLVFDNFTRFNLLNKTYAVWFTNLQY